MKTDRTINENNMQHESPDVKKPTSKPREIQDGSRIEDCDSESQSSVESSLQFESNSHEVVVPCLNEYHSEY